MNQIMKEKTIHTRLDEIQLSKINAIAKRFKLKNESEAMRASINVAYNCIFENEEYLIDFYNIRGSLLWKWLNKKETNNNVKGK